MVVSNDLHHSLRMHSYLAVESWVDLGDSGVARSSVDGVSACARDPLARKGRVQDFSAQAVSLG